MVMIEFYIVEDSIDLHIDSGNYYRTTVQHAFSR